MSQIDTEKDKKPKVSQFSKFLGIFLKFLTDIVSWNVEKGQQKNVLSSMLREVINAVFQVERVCRKRQNFEIF